VQELRLFASLLFALPLLAFAFLPFTWALQKWCADYLRHKYNSSNFVLMHSNPKAQSTRFGVTKGWEGAGVLIYRGGQEKQANCRLANKSFGKGYKGGGQWSVRMARIRMRARTWKAGWLAGDDNWQLQRSADAAPIK